MTVADKTLLGAVKTSVGAGKIRKKSDKQKKVVVKNGSLPELERGRQLTNCRPGGDIFLCFATVYTQALFHPNESHGMVRQWIIDFIPKLK